MPEQEHHKIIVIQQEIKRVRIQVQKYIITKKGREGNSYNPTLPYKPITYTFQVISVLCPY